MELVLLMTLAVFGITFLDTGNGDDAEEADTDGTETDLTGSPEELDTSTEPMIPDVPIGPDDSDEPGVPDVPEEGSDILSILTSGVFDTGDGDDTISLDASGDAENVTLDAGDGDDLVDLAGDTPLTEGYEAFEDVRLDTSTISGGDGDDTISAVAEYSLIEGGAGDDEIFVGFGNGSTVTGGEGDDLLSGLQLSSDALSLDGGVGNDTIDGTQIENGTLLGGDGDDLILMSGEADTGAGYALSADGGAGNDILQFSGGGITAEGSAPNSMTGGEGADVFELDISEGGSISADQEAALLQTDGSVLLQSIRITDFESGTDMLMVDGDAQDEGYTLTTARIESGETNALILRYEHATELTREVVIDLADSGITWNDVGFTGDDVPVLEPITPSGS